MCFGTVTEILPPLSISISHCSHPVWFKQELKGWRDFKRFRGPRRTIQTRPEKTFRTAPQRNPDYSTMTLSVSACDVRWIKWYYKEVQVKRNDTKRKDEAAGHRWSRWSRRSGEVWSRPKRKEEALNSTQPPACRPTYGSTVNIDEQEKNQIDGSMVTEEGRYRERESPEVGKNVVHHCILSMPDEKKTTAHTRDKQCWSIRNKQTQSDTKLRLQRENKSDLNPSAEHRGSFQRCLNRTNIFFSGVYGYLHKHKRTKTGLHQHRGRRGIWFPRVRIQ